MKASELVKELIDAIEIFGDYSVEIALLKEGNASYDGITVFTDSIESYGVITLYGYFI